MADNRIMASRLDRRITIQKPNDARDSENETQAGYVTLFSNFPAWKSESGSGESEDLKLGTAIRAEVELEWEIRYFGYVHPKAKWRIIDEYGNKHDIIAPPTEIGRRQGWKLKTRQVE